MSNNSKNVSDKELSSLSDPELNNNPFIKVDILSDSGTSNNIMELENDFDQVKSICETDRYSKDCNKFMLKKELLERKTLLHDDENNNGMSHLYPNLNDPNFIVKIAEKKEFNDTKYDGTIHKNIK